MTNFGRLSHMPPQLLHCALEVESFTSTPYLPYMYELHFYFLFYNFF